MRRYTTPALTSARTVSSRATNRASSSPAATWSSSWARAFALGHRRRRPIARTLVVESSVRKRDPHRAGARYHDRAGITVGKRFPDFGAFYPVYLAMHRHPTNRLMHVAGNLLGLGAIALAVASRTWWLLALAPAFASGLASIGHRWFEKNRPGVRDYPVYGTLGSWRMTWEILTGARRPERLRR